MLGIFKSLVNKTEKLYIAEAKILRELPVL
jgi:hypothetical protein